MNKADLVEVIHKVGRMDTEELEDYRSIVTVSDVDGKAKGFIMRAIDMRLNPVPVEESLVEYSEIRAGEWKI